MTQLKGFQPSYWPMDRVDLEREYKRWAFNQIFGPVWRAANADEAWKEYRRLKQQLDFVLDLIEGSMENESRGQCQGS